jgi:hypothetical protein
VTLRFVNECIERILEYLPLPRSHGEESIDGLAGEILASELVRDLLGETLLLQFLLLKDFLNRLAGSEAMHL